jgi:transcriptional regulator with XRE-family HTH domain
MSSEIVRVKGGFDYTKAHAEAQKRLAYYEEGLVVDVAARVIDAMEARSVTRSELARRLDVSPAYITKILRGHANLSLESLAKVAFALDLKWECVLIPKSATIGVLSLTDDDGGTAIRAVETATVEGLGTESGPEDDNDYAEGTRYELPLSA